MSVPTDADLYRAGTETLLAAWTEYARGSDGAAVVRSPGVAAAVFPTEPARSVYNNAVLDRDLDAAARSDALDAMEAAYAAAGVASFAAWAHEADPALRGDLERRGYRLSESTRAMGMALEDVRLPRPQLDLAQVDWSEYQRTFLLPGLLSGAVRDAFHVLVAQVAGESVSTAMGYDAGADTGVYNVGTLDHARRRGMGTALTTLLLHDAIGRGRRTASLQSTPMAERVYAAVGFRDLGRILEFVP